MEDLAVSDISVVVRDSGTMVFDADYAEIERTTM